MLANFKKGFNAKAKVNFNSWSLKDWSESWDDPQYFFNLFDNKRDQVYEFQWDGQEFWELVNCKDERRDTLFESNQLIFI